jgi:hypothetical protein
MEAARQKAPKLGVGSPPEHFHASLRLRNQDVLQECLNHAVLRKLEPAYRWSAQHKAFYAAHFQIREPGLR